jgi:hypothetical protein
MEMGVSNMKILLAKFRRFLHSLWTFHGGLDLTNERGLTIACYDCGKIFYGDPQSFKVYHL